MPRCHTTRNAVYEQHRCVARLLSTGMPYSFEVMILPGHRVNYIRNPRIDAWGAHVDGKYQYDSSDPGWCSFEYSDAKDKMAPVIAGECSLFEVLCTNSNPYKLR